MSCDPVEANLGSYRERRKTLLLLANDQAGRFGLCCGKTARCRGQRMYVCPAARFRHLGSLILDRLIHEARTMGADAPSRHGSVHDLSRARLAPFCFGMASGHRQGRAVIRESIR